MVRTVWISSSWPSDTRPVVRFYRFTFWNWYPQGNLNQAILNYRDSMAFSQLYLEMDNKNWSGDFKSCCWRYCITKVPYLRRGYWLLSPYSWKTRPVVVLPAEALLRSQWRQNCYRIPSLADCTIHMKANSPGIVWVLHRPWILPPNHPQTVVRIPSCFLKTDRQVFLNMRFCW